MTNEKDVCRQFGIAWTLACTGKNHITDKLPFFDVVLGVVPSVVNQIY